MGHKPWDMPWRRAERRRAKQAWRNEAGEELRFYGTDSTDEFETIAEATRLDDGTLHLDFVLLDKRH